MHTIKWVGFKHLVYFYFFYCIIPRNSTTVECNNIIKTIIDIY